MAGRIFAGSFSILQEIWERKLLNFSDGRGRFSIFSGGKTGQGNRSRLFENIVLAWWGRSFPLS
jgi:hypothetical protein